MDTELLNILKTIFAQGSDLCSIIGTAIIVAMIPRIKRLGNNDIAILRSKIKALAHDLLEKGFVTDEEAIEFDSLYDCYIAMGGNSFIIELAERVHKLPLK